MATPETHRWGVFEAVLTSARDYENPFWDVTVRVRLTAPSGTVHEVEGFWDAGRIWRVRFCPDETGEWSWSSTCSSDDDGLHDQRGAFRCVAYAGDNPLYQHGPARLSADRRSLTYADGTPFFWLGDTAWNGVLRAQPDDWNMYLRMRQQQGFSVIQFVSTQWRGLSSDPSGETAFDGAERTRLNPHFFQRLDPKVRAINEHGLVGAPIMLWAIWPSDPGQYLSEAGAARLARYLAARWGAFHVIWMLAGDGNYHDQAAERWRRIGRAVFGDRHDRLATMHPRGQDWVGEEFRDEPWFDVIGYQSGHGSSEQHLRWLVFGPPATDWANPPAKPVINLEPNYEGHMSYHIDRPFNDHEVRRAAYWSLLVSPAAGVTYGNNSIWVWPEEPAEAEGHPRLGIIAPWREGIDTPGVRSMAVLRAFFDGLPWWRLAPAPDLLAAQPGTEAPERFVAAARANGDPAICYTPAGAAVRLRAGALATGTQARWFNPRSGTWLEAGAVDGSEQSFAPPDEHDWVLVLGAAA